MGHYPPRLLRTLSVFLVFACPIVPETLLASAVHITVNPVCRNGQCTSSVAYLSGVVIDEAG